MPTRQFVKVVSLHVWLKGPVQSLQAQLIIGIVPVRWIVHCSEKGLPAVKRIGSRGSSELTRSLLNLEEVHVPDLSPLERRPIETTGGCSGKAVRVFPRGQGIEPTG